MNNFYEISYRLGERKKGEIGGVVSLPRTKDSINSDSTNSGNSFLVLGFGGVRLRTGVSCKRYEEVERGRERRKVERN